MINAQPISSLNVVTALIEVFQFSQKSQTKD